MLVRDFIESVGRWCVDYRGIFNALHRIIIDVKPVYNVFFGSRYTIGFGQFEGFDILRRMILHVIQGRAIVEWVLESGPLGPF